MSDLEPSHAASRIPLKALVGELRSRCEAIARLQGGSTYFHEELGIFRACAQERGLILQAEPLELSRAPDDEGNEHQVWFQQEPQSYLKATWPGFFGLLVIHQPAIAGKPATDEEIRRFFTDSGWLPFVSEGNLAPIDLRVQPISGSLLDTATKLCSP